MTLGLSWRGLKEAQPPCSNYEKFWGVDLLSSNVFEAGQTHGYAFAKGEERKGIKVLLQGCIFCWTENRYFEDIYKLCDIFALTTTIHFKRQSQQAAIKAKQIVYWSSLCRDNLYDL